MMKRLLLFSFMCFIRGLLYAQGGSIAGMSIIPLNPTETDSVKLVLDVYVNSAPCTLDNFSWNISGSQIDLQTNYCGGMLTVICSRTDTINLGLLPAGTYQLNNTMFAGCAPYQLADTAGITFQVLFSTGTNQLNVVKPPPYQIIGNVLYLNSDSQDLYDITCYSAGGQELNVYKNCTGATAVELPEKQGIYIVQLFHVKKRSHSVIKYVKF